MEERKQPIRSNLPAIIKGSLMRNWPVGGPQIDIQYVPPETLKLPLRMLRKHSKKQLAQIEASIDRFGFVTPIQVGSDSRIVSGVGRWLAATTMGLALVPVVRLDHLTKTELRFLAIAENKLASLSKWDEKLLTLELGELILETDLDIEITGFDTVEIDNLLLGQALAHEAETIELPDPDAVAITRIGDLFQLGDHRLLCADARDPLSYAMLLGTERARMAFSNPPFNVHIDGNVSGLGAVKHREFVMASGEMSRDQYIAFLTLVFQHLAANSADGAIHFQCIDWGHSADMQLAGEASYTEYKNNLASPSRLGRYRAGL